ncbi:MAG: response regulator [Lachnospiraceae bacterium]|nr:response regulator [Lachnospiraceae bacterium]
MGKRVMVCDDAAFIRMSLRMIVEKCGYETVGDPKNGLEAVEQYNIYRPDLVFMDITMPEMNGIAATQAIRKEHPDALIVAVTSMGHEAMVLQAMQSGMKDFIVKPYKEDDIKKSLAKLLG